MKIYCNDQEPEEDKDGYWINPTYETPDDYTCFMTDRGALDVRVNKHREVAVYIPNDATLHDPETVDIGD